DCVVGMPVPFWSAMYSIMFGTGVSLKVGRVITLQPLDCCKPKSGGQIWVFAVCLLSASPSGVAKDIDIWRPKRQSVIASPLVAPNSLIIFRPRFVRNNFKSLEMICLVPCGCHTDRLWKYSGFSRTRYAMERLIPPIVCGDPEPGHRL